MEGILWKWTNYWNGKCYSIKKEWFSLKNLLSNVNIVEGWQTRWFVLEEGCLAYYKSQEEVKQGCKGSIKVLACEINGKYWFN